MSIVCIAEENESLLLLSGKDAQGFAAAQFAWADIDLTQLTYPHECYTLVDGKAVEIPEAASRYTYLQGRDSINGLTVEHPVSGNVYDADMAARDALTTAVAAGEPGEFTYWKLADNSVVTVGWQELKEVLRLVGHAHTAVIAVP